MKLLLITKDDCPYCIEMREMVFRKLPELMPDLKVEECDLYNDKEKYEAYYPYSVTPGFSLLTEKNHCLLTIRGAILLQGLHDYILEVSKKITGQLADDELESVTGGMQLATNIACSQIKTCIETLKK